MADAISKVIQNQFLTTRYVSIACYHVTLTMNNYKYLIIKDIL